jgi:hypothetical protein
LSTDAGPTACHDSVMEEQRKVPSIEVSRVGGDHQVVEKDNEKKPQEAPQIESATPHTVEYFVSTELS